MQRNSWRSIGTIYTVAVRLNISACVENFDLVIKNSKIVLLSNSYIASKFSDSE